MKYLVTIHKLNNYKSLLTYADGLVVGLKGFSTRETSSLTVEEFKFLANEVNGLNKEVYISFKPLLFNDKIETIKALFKELKNVNYSGVIVGDLGYYYLLTELGVNNLIYNPETLLTNSTDILEAFNIGFTGVFISKEITLEDIKKIIAEKTGNIFITAHGYLNMFYSKRSLIKNYLKEANLTYPYTNKQTLKLKERKREDFYPIIEDEFGTHIFRNNISSIIYQLKDFKDANYLLIDSIFHDDDYGLKILKLFQDEVSEDMIKKLQSDYNESWDEGFLFTKTIYKRDE